MSVRDDFRKIVDDLREDLKDDEGHLRWLLDEIGRHLDIHDVQSEPEVPELEEEGGDDETEDEEPADFSTLTVAELKAYAETNEIDLGDATKKADIVAVLEAAGAAPDGGGDDETEDES